MDESKFLMLTIADSDNTIMVNTDNITCFYNRGNATIIEFCGNEETYAMVKESVEAINMMIHQQQKEHMEDLTRMLRKVNDINAALLGMRGSK